ARFGKPSLVQRRATKSWPSSRRGARSEHAGRSSPSLAAVGWFLQRPLVPVVGIVRREAAKAEGEIGMCGGERCTRACGHVGQRIRRSLRVPRRSRSGHAAGSLGEGRRGETGQARGNGRLVVIRPSEPPFGVRRVFGLADSPRPPWAGLAGWGVDAPGRRFIGCAVEGPYRSPFRGIWCTDPSRDG